MINEATMTANISAAALALVNDAREALGMRALFAWFKGYPQHADCCPVSYALAGSDERSIPTVNGVTILFPCPEEAGKVAEAWGRKTADGLGHIHAHDHFISCMDFNAREELDLMCMGRLVVLPFVVAAFIRHFDRGAYPAITKTVLAEKEAA